MTVFTGPVFNWRTSGLDWDKPPYESNSPNLEQIAAYMREMFGGGSMGIHFDKQTTSGVVSEHSWGAADDWGTGQPQVDWIKSVGRPVGRVLTRAEHFAAVDWVVAHSAELHIQSIVDIGRSWRADRTDNGAGGWKTYSSGYTGHAHFVTTFDGWSDATPVADRLAKPTPPPEPAPTPDPTPDPPTEELMRFVQLKDDAAVYIISGLTARWVRNGAELVELADRFGISATPNTISDRSALKAYTLLGHQPQYPGHASTVTTSAADFAGAS